MGTTIQGWIEIEFSTCPGKWYAVVRLEPFVGISKKRSKNLSSGMIGE